MTRDEIIKMAREAGLAGVESPEGLAAFVFRFAALVAAAEREACTKVCDAASEPRRGYDGQTDELLEALAKLVEDLEMRSNWKRGDDKGVVDCGHSVYLKARAAISKAGGAV